MIKTFKNQNHESSSNDLDKEFNNIKEKLEKYFNNNEEKNFASIQKIIEYARNKIKSKNQINPYTEEICDFFTKSEPFRMKATSYL